MKISTVINKFLKRKAIKKINKMKGLSVKKINKMSSKFDKNKWDKTQITNIINVRKDFTRDSIIIKITKRKHYENFIVINLMSQKKWIIFLKNHKLPTLNQDETDNMNSSITFKN